MRALDYFVLHKIHINPCTIPREKRSNKHKFQQKVGGGGVGKVKAATNPFFTSRYTY